MLTRTERRQAQEHVEAKLEELRQVLQAYLAPEVDRCSTALLQVDKMQRWLVRQIEETGSG